MRFFEPSLSATTCRTARKRASQHTSADTLEPTEINNDAAIQTFPHPHMNNLFWMASLCKQSCSLFLLPPPLSASLRHTVQNPRDHFRRWGGAGWALLGALLRPVVTPKIKVGHGWSTQYPAGLTQPLALLGVHGARTRSSSRISSPHSAAQRLPTSHANTTKWYCCGPRCSSTDLWDHNLTPACSIHPNTHAFHYTWCSAMGGNQSQAPGGPWWCREFAEFDLEVDGTRAKRATCKPASATWLNFVRPFAYHKFNTVGPVPIAALHLPISISILQKTEVKTSPCHTPRDTILLDILVSHATRSTPAFGPKAKCV